MRVGPTARCNVQVLAGLDDPDPVAGETGDHELGREPVAGHHEDVAGAVGVPVEGGPEPTQDARRADPAGRLMQHPDDRRPDTAEPGGGGARRDAVQNEHVGSAGRTREQPRGSGRRRPRQRQVGDRDEPELSAVVRRALREAPVEQVAARHAAWIADR